MQETPVLFLGQEDLLEKGQATHSSILGLPGGSDGKECACNAGDLGWEDPHTLQVYSLPTGPQVKPKNTGVGSLSLLQQIFLTQGSNQGLLYCGQILYQLSYQGSLNG